MLYRIFNQLPNHVLATITSVCRQFNALIDDRNFLQSRLSRMMTVNPEFDPKIYLIIAPHLLRAIRTTIKENVKVNQQTEKYFPNILSIRLKDLNCCIFLINENEPSEKYFRFSRRDKSFIRIHGCGNLREWNNWIKSGVVKITSHTFYPQKVFSSNDKPLLNYILSMFNRSINNKKISPNNDMIKCTQTHQIKEIYFINETSLLVSGNNIANLALSTLKTAAYKAQQYAVMPDSNLVMDFKEFLGRKLTEFEQEQFEDIKAEIYHRATLPLTESDIKNDLDYLLLKRPELASDFKDHFPDLWG